MSIRATDAALFRAAREAAGLSQAELAERVARQLGRRQSSVACSLCRFERGHRGLAPAVQVASLRELAAEGATVEAVEAAARG